jgi:hypothetical protein
MMVPFGSVTSKEPLEGGATVLVGRVLGPSSSTLAAADADAILSRAAIHRLAVGGTSTVSRRRCDALAVLGSAVALELATQRLAAVRTGNGSAASFGYSALTILRA